VLGLKNRTLYPGRGGRELQNRMCIRLCKFPISAVIRKYRRTVGITKLTAFKKAHKMGGI
jgi:hypothetical protein